MSDYLVNLSSNKTARFLVRKLGLPVPLPQPLDRAFNPWAMQPLQGKTVFFCSGSGALLPDLVAGSLLRMGADLWIQGGSLELPGTKRLDPALPPGQTGADALVFDATGFKDPDNLDELYHFFHAQVRGLNACGRTLVLLRPPEEARDPLVRATLRAVEGFIRSLGRELGRKGSTALTVHVDTGAEERIEPVLHFFLSNHSAYISGQSIHISAQVPLVQGASFEKPLAGKTALVTGSARGIGAATARALAREGAKVILMDRPAEMEAAATVANAIGGETLGCDITDAAAAERIHAHIADRHGGLDILVHNAGITRDKTLANMDDARWNQVLDVNLRALIRVNEALRDLLSENARIVCLSSVGGIAGNFGQTNYTTTKAGLIGYVQGLAPLLAARGITVNAVAPGFIETKMTAAMPFGTREGARRLCNLSQGGQPEDIAETIAFLVSPGAAGLSGEVLRVCGGSFLGA